MREKLVGIKADDKTTIIGDPIGREALLEELRFEMIPYTPEELVETRQWVEAVRAALATLTEEQRDAIALRFFAGLSAREAAEAMGRQEGTVRGLQFRAIAALRRQLAIEPGERKRKPVIETSRRR